MLVAVRRLVVGRFVVGEDVVEGLLHARGNLAIRRESADEVNEHGTQVRAVAAKHRGALALPKEEGEDRHVGLCAVAVGAGEHQVVAAVVCALATARGNMVERDGRGGDAAAAVGAESAMLFDEPPLGFRVRGAARGGGCQLGGGGTAAPATSGAFSRCRHNGGNARKLNATAWSIRESALFGRLSAEPERRHDLSWARVVSQTTLRRTSAFQTGELNSRGGGMQVARVRVKGRLGFAGSCGRRSMRVREWAVLVMMLAPLACRTGQPGSSFASALILAPLSELEAAHDELLQADLARADSVARLGYAGGLTSTFAAEVLYLRGGLPILRSRAAAHAVVAAEPVGANTAVRWQPVRAETSQDAESGYTYGYTIYGYGTAGAPTLRVDRYIAFWRKRSAGWRIVAYAETYGAPPAALTLSAGVTDSLLADVPMSRRRGALDEIRVADEEFSQAATKLGTGEAFGRYAAQDAQMFSPPGEFITGPLAITGSFGPATEGSSLVWHPVEGEVARSGDLGFTVGNAVFTGVRDDGATLVSYSKYLTVWKRQRDGTWRFVVDGGSARPKP